jgi:hypothetical protein
LKDCAVLRASIIFVCGVTAGALVYDMMIERMAVVTLPQVECIWLASPVRASNDLKQCFVIGYRWGR